MVFHFKNEPFLERSEILFVKAECIFSLNFKTWEVTIFFKFSNNLNHQPQFFELTDDQNILIISSAEDCLYVNLNTGLEKDINSLYEISDIKEVKYDNTDHDFYILSNKQFGRLGFFVQRISANDPTKSTFLIRWKNKLDIGDTNIQKLSNSQMGFKEICISYKSIYINTYTIMILDVTPGVVDQSIMFRHESFQLWESHVSSSLISKNNDFVTLNKDGINVFALGSKDKRPI